MQPPAGPFPLRPHPGAGEPDRGHQIPAGELGEHPRVDAVGLARQRRQSLDPRRVRDLDVPAQLLEMIVHEPSAVHRLDHAAHRLLEPPTRRTRLGSPSRSGGVHVSNAVSPASSSTRTSRRFLLRSNPACNMVQGLLGELVPMRTHKLSPGRPLFMTTRNYSPGPITRRSRGSPGITNQVPRHPPYPRDAATEGRRSRQGRQRTSRPRHTRLHPERLPTRPPRHAGPSRRRVPPATRGALNGLSSMTRAATTMRNSLSHEITDRERSCLRLPTVPRVEASPVVPEGRTTDGPLGRPHTRDRA